LTIHSLAKASQSQKIRSQNTLADIEEEHRHERLLQDTADIEEAPAAIVVIRSLGSTSFTNILHMEEPSTDSIIADSPFTFSQILIIINLLSLYL
jgi:hypothetical protein